LGVYFLKISKYKSISEHDLSEVMKTMKALEQWQIEDCRKQHSEGKTYYQLAQLYSCHPRTIENYCKPELPGQIRIEGIGFDIKVISTTPGKTLNFKGVTKIDKKPDWIRIMKEEEVIALLTPENITAIIPMEG
jgi:hypothetical protein